MKSIRIAVTSFAVMATLPLWAGELKLGKPINVQATTSVHELLANPEKYLGKEIKIEGEITAVCQRMGCWINVKDPSTKETIQVKVNDGEIVFPKDGAGKKVVAQGKLEKLNLSKDQYIALLEDQASESGQTADISKITAGKTLYRIKGQGAVIK